MDSRLRNVFWNEDARRLRAPWRLVAFVVVLLAVGLVVGLVAFGLGDAIERVLLEVWPTAPIIVALRELVVIGVQLTTFVGSVYLAARFVDRRRFRDLGLRIDAAWWRDLAFGLVLGATLMAGIFLVEYAAGWIVVTDTASVTGSPLSVWQAVAVSLVLFVAVGTYEELLVRGYLFTNVAEGLTWIERIDRRWAVGLATVATSLLFGVAHAANPNADLASTIGIFLAGFMLAAGYVLSGELAIPIGIHVTWNFVQGPILGFPVSGLGLDASVLEIRQGGPALFTGGSFGPEAGLLGVLASVVGIALIAAWVAHHDGRLQIAPAITTPDLRTTGDE